MSSSKILALVLSCDKYSLFADHMIRAYNRLWPTHPFKFVVPYNADQPPFQPDQPERVEFIQSPTDIRATMDTLLERASQEAWVYWCIDDKYPEQINTDQANRCAFWIQELGPEVEAVSFCRANMSMISERLEADQPIHTPYRQVYYRRMPDMWWVHQFIRPEGLRKMLSPIPHEIQQAVQMDDILRHHYAQGHPRWGWTENIWYVLKDNAIVFGESTTQGAITANCLESLQHHGMLPQNIPTTNQRIQIGTFDYTPHNPSLSGANWQGGILNVRCPNCQTSLKVDRPGQWECPACMKPFGVENPNPHTNQPFTTYVSQHKQDKWVIEDVFNGKRNGFFLDMGAADGVKINNTYLLEKQYGWTGICVEPWNVNFEKLRKNRHCTCANELVDGSSHIVDFWQGSQDDGHYAGIIDADTDAAKPQHAAHLTQAKALGRIEKRQTITLTQLLDKYQAPKTIDYFSFDVEGAEERILKGFDFSRYKFLTLTIERPTPEVNRLLREHGYIFVENRKCDTFYIHEDNPHRNAIDCQPFEEHPQLKRSV